MVFEKDTHDHILAHHGDFAAFADAMVESHARRFDAVFWSFLGLYAPASAKVIADFGTGPGLLLPELAEHYGASRVIGVDGQPEMLKRAEDVRETHDNVELIAHDLGSEAHTSIEAGSVDVVVASMLLHELQVPTRMLDEAARILKPGGTLFVYDWVRQPLASYSDGERPHTLDRFTHFSEHCRYAPEDLHWLVEKSGFGMKEWILRRNGGFILMAAERS